MLYLSGAPLMFDSHKLRQNWSSLAHIFLTLQQLKYPPILQTTFEFNYKILHRIISQENIQNSQASRAVFLTPYNIDWFTPGYPMWLHTVNLYNKIDINRVDRWGWDQIKVFINVWTIQFSSPANWEPFLKFLIISNIFFGSECSKVCEERWNSIGYLRQEVVWENVRFWKSLITDTEE